MRRSKHSLLKAFGAGMLWAGAGTLGAFGMHAYFAPPADTTASDHIKMAIAELVPGVARWAQFPLASSATSANQPVGSMAPLVDDARPSQLDETALREAQTRVAKRQADVQANRILVQSIQQELARVGCYAGAIDGQWSDGTRSAMGAFTERLKVRLPLTSPDYILLTMLQGHSRNACGSDTANGTSVVATARSLQAGVPVQAGLAAVTSGQAKSGQGKATRLEADAASPAPALPTQQFRTAVTPAPMPNANRQARQPTEVRVTSAQLPAAEPMPQFVSPYMAPASPLPGRMAVGVPTRPDDTPAVRAEKPSGTPQPVAIVPPAPPARAPQPNRAAPRAEPVRTAASPQRQNSGGGNSGGGGNTGGGGSRGQVFSRLGSSAP